MHWEERGTNLLTPLGKIRTHPLPTQQDSQIAPNKTRKVAKPKKQHANEKKKPQKLVHSQSK